MKSLLPRIFLSFWIAMTAVGTAFAAIQITSAPQRLRRLPRLVAETLRLHGEDAVRAVESGHPDAALNRLRGYHDRTGMRAVVLGGPAPLGPFPPLATEAARAARAARRRHATYTLQTEDTELVAVPLQLARGAPYVIVGEIQRPSQWERIVGADTLPLRILVLCLISGIVSFALARYLSRPIQHLRRAAQRLAEGDLSVRVTPAVTNATDDVAALGHDLDRMAERIAELLAAQQRLLRDVSHELRSPLARVNVALELARQRAGADATGPLDRIERETERLNELIGQILAVSRVESDAQPRTERVDLAAVVEDVVRDADFEARGLERRVELVASEPVEVRGNRELLHGAVENVVRNAARFTPAGSAVEVRLSSSSRAGERVARVEVRDHGPGVPEESLADIFRPFYRVGTARDRHTGGTGIGLAITERAVRLHGGSVRASHADGGGLVVTLELPIERA